MHYARRTAHLTALFTLVQSQRLELQLAAVTDYRFGAGAFCGASRTCAVGGLIPIGLPSLTWWRGRTGLAVEGAGGGQTLGSRLADAEQAEIAHRQTHVAFLVRRSLRSKGPRPLRLAVGPALVLGDSRGFQRIRGPAPLGGRHVGGQRVPRIGVVGGLDVVMRVRPSITSTLPVRYMTTFGAPADTWPGSSDLSIGVGFAATLARSTGL
jgi:hypothetical protein